MTRKYIAIATLALSGSPLVAQSQASLPADAQALRSSYIQAKERAVQPLTAKYKAELEKLLNAHTKAGRLDDALAIRQELESMNEPTSVPSISSPAPKANSKAERIRAELSGSRWNLAGHRQPHIMTLEPDGKISFEPSDDAPRIVAWFVDDAGDLYTRESTVGEPRKSVLERGNKQFSMFWGPQKTATRIKEK